MTEISQKSHMNIVVAGHVDHGKSTVIGRLLADAHAIPDGKLEQIQEMCRKNARPFEYAFLLDALKEERAQGITIDTARCFFETDKRKYIIIDAPGHIEFLKNMITGASRAEAALLVIDAKEGICENSRRHGYMMEMLGVGQIAVLVNKIDLIGYDQKTYDEICRGYTEFLQNIGVTPSAFIPVSAMEGDNIARRSERTPWYRGVTVLEQLDRFNGGERDDDKPLRIPVEDVYKFTESGDDRRIVAGLCESGCLKNGDDVVFYPSGKTTKVKKIEEWFMEDSPERASNAVYQGKSCGFTTETQIYVRRGEIACKVGEESPRVGKTFRASMFWLGREPLVCGREYILKSCTAKTTCKVQKIHSVLDASDLTKTIAPERANKNDIADCTFVCAKEIAFDIGSRLPATGRFVLVDNYEISGGGVITEAMTEQNGAKRSGAAVTASERRRHMNQIPAYVFCPDREYAELLERALFEEERRPYYAAGLSGEEIELLLRAGMIAISDNGEREADYTATGDAETDMNRILMLTKAALGR